MARILVIDDETQMREMLCQMLERAGYEVFGVPEGKAGMKAHRGNAFDLIITDLIMPGQEGLETIMEIRRNYSGLKVIAISGGGRNQPEDYLDLARKLGANITLAKPFSREDILNAVKELLG